MRSYGLTTEQQHGPLGLGERQPRLSWKLDSDRPGAAQTAYRITAAERADHLDDPPCCAGTADGGSPPRVNVLAAIVADVVDFADGSRRVIATDGGWTERPGAIRSADLLMGQRVDARQHVQGWDAPGAVPTTVTGFQPVMVVDTDPGPLVSEPDEPVRVTLDVPAVTVQRRGPHRFIVDCGQNLVGRVRLTVRGAGAGRTITLRHAEVLCDGELYVDNLRRATATDSYTAGGAPTEVFEPQFTVHGFRYVASGHYTFTAAAPAALPPTTSDPGDPT